MTLPTVEQLNRVFSLEADIYADTARDSGATGPALLVVFGAAFLEGVGDLGGGIAGFLRGVLELLVIWGVWVVVIQATAILVGERSNFAGLFRALGFAAAPFGLGLLENLPFLGGLFWLAKWVLVFSAFVIATRRVEESEALRALVTCGLALIAALLVAGPITNLFPG